MKTKATNPHIQPSMPKVAKRVEVKLLVPWGIIALLIALSSGFIGGYHTNQQIEQTIDNRANARVELSKSQAQ